MTRPSLWLTLAPVLVVCGLWSSEARAQVDYDGEDVTISTDTTWNGVHENIGTLKINLGATLRSTNNQELIIRAETVEVFGHLSGDQRGRAGGAAGGRGEGGRRGSGPGRGQHGDTVAVCGFGDFNAGGGGGGAGSYIGAGGEGGWGADANDGGCQGAEGGAGGNTTADFDNFRTGAGAGGGGGAGGARNVVGTAGERGGGWITIEAHTVRIEGLVSADGGRGGRGGTSPDFFHGAGGGGGASGGAIHIVTTFLVGSGEVRAAGGDGGAGGQGDTAGANSYRGAGGGGGGGGLIVLERANDDAWTGTCAAPGGAPGAGSNTNGGPGAAGGAGVCDVRTINGRPTANAGGPYITAEGNAVMVDGSLSVDPDGDTPLTYEWDCDDNGSFETPGQMAECIFLDDGRFDITLRVTDPMGAFGTDTAEVVVTEGPPIADITGPDEIDEGGTVNVDASASDGLGDNITQYEWDFDYDGTFDVGETTTVPTASTDYCDNGPYTIAVRVTDDGGSTNVALHRVTVRNVPPTVDSTPPTNVVEGQEYTYQLEVSDVGCDTFSYQAVSAPPGFMISSSGLVTWTPDLATVEAGSAFIRVLVSDDDFGRTFHEWTVDIARADADGDGLPDAWETDNGLDPNDPDDAMGDRDGDGRNELEEFSADTDPNNFDGPTAPTLSVPVDGGEVGVTEPVLRSFRATSPLQEELTYDFELYSFVDDPALLMPELLLASTTGISIPDASSTIDWMVPDTASLEDHTSYCWRARAMDSRVPGPWSDLWCFFVNLGNEAPSGLTPLLPVDGEKVDESAPTLVLGNCTDPDDDPLTYTFILYRGESVDRPVTSTLGVPGGEDGMTSWRVDVLLQENTQYCWRAQCRDNQGLASDFSALSCFVVDESNELPDTPVFIAPVPQGDQPRATVREVPVQMVVENVTDPEGSELTYRFELDTANTFDSPDYVYGEVAEGISGQTIWEPEVDWQDNQIYYARASAFDGEGSSGFATTEFLLNFDNDPPTAPVVVTPVNNLIIFSRQPTLTIRNSSDFDDDVLRYQFQVFHDENFERIVDNRAGVNETPEITQFTLESTPLTDGTYFWRARANDGFIDGPWSNSGSFVIQGSKLEDIDVPVDEDGNNGGGGSGSSSEDGCGCSSVARTTGPGTLTIVLVSLALAAALIRRRRAH